MATAATATGAARKGGFNPYVHGARGLFSAMVLVFHVANSGLPTFAYPGSAWVESYLLSFKFGVELFFGISGIVILGALSRARSFGTFAWDRFTRIYPVLWASLTAILLSGLAVHAKLPGVGAILLNYAVPPPGVIIPMLNPAAWSLSFEIAFYLLCAIAWTQRRRAAVPAVAAVVGVALICVFPRTLLMLPGVLIGVSMLRFRPIMALSRFPLAMVLLFLAAWRAIEIAQGGHTGAISIAIMPLATWCRFAPAILGAGILGSAALLGIVEGRGPFARLLLTRPVQWMGTVSYSFYLWHPLALEAAKRALLAAHVLQGAGAASQLLILATGAPAALLLAWASQALIERRFTRWLRALAERPVDVHTPVTAAPPSPDRRRLRPADEASA